MILIAGAILVNAALSVLGACVMAFAARAVLGRSSRWAKWIFSLPFVKMVFDVARGIPSGAFVRSPFAGTRFEQGRFQIGVGIHPPELVPLRGLEHDGRLRHRSGDRHPQEGQPLIGEESLTPPRD